jgi:apolipoprotein D and lipocalin family protein
MIPIFHIIFRCGVFALTFWLMGCATAPPEGMTAVSPFDVQRYQGTWYEVARLDHSFERDMRDVTARYAVQADGSVQVLNRGFDMKKNDWREAIGKAKFIGDTQRASLKVSFFGPFYGGYHVIALDPTYSWSMVVGPDRDYLWILSRSNTLDPVVKAQLRTQALALGLPFDRLIWVEHQRQ